MTHPVDNISWLPAESLDGNIWNPNFVYGPELKLLKLSMLKQGWVQPILVSEEEDGKHVIIDGFHRWSLTKDDKQLSDMTKGLVPCAVLKLTKPERMLLTVRINRAKGNHIAVKMHELVTELVEQHGYSKAQVAEEIGASKDEIDILLAENVFKKLKTPEHQYSKAWYPKGAKVE